MASTNRYVYANKAVGSNGTVTVTANPARLVCGGADDGDYVSDDSKTEELVLTAATKVTMLKQTDTGILPAPVALSDVPNLLANDLNTRYFQVVTSGTAVSSFEELYHP